MERIKEYSLIFKEGTNLYKRYDGEFISENKEEVDYLFENNIEQVKEYYVKEWVRENQDEDWEEDDSEIYYSITIIEEMERKALARQLYECYMLDTENDENCIKVIDAFKEECTKGIYTDEKTRKEMVELLEKEFENNGYEISKNNGFYYYDGKLKQVEPDFDFVAVKNEKTKEI